MCIRDRSVRVQPLSRGLGVQLVKIDADDLSGDGMAGPALLYQRNEKRAGLFHRAEPFGAAGGGVGMTVDRGIGGDHQNIAGAGGGAGSCGSRLDDAEHWLGDGLLNGVCLLYTSRCV